MIENIAKFMVENNFVDLADIFSETIMPFSFFLGNLGFVFAFPLIYVLSGQSGEEYANLIGLNFKETMPDVMKRAHELKAEKERTEKSGSRLDQLKRWLRGD